MQIVMPPVRQTPTANYSPVPIRHDLFRWHFMEGGYLGSISWLCNPIAKASAHLCLKADASEVSQLVPMGLKGWDACAFNGRGVGLEIEGFTAKGLADVTLDAAALIAAWYCLTYGLSPVWAEGGQGRGICTHHDLGLGGGGHTDICGVGDATWQRCLTATQNAYAALKPLQSRLTWALHGLPSPAEVVAAPFVPATPSHGGASRNEPGDIIRHPTASGYAAHSIAALQADLNTLGAFPPLAVDGGMGPLTERALSHFQATYGIGVDGKIGPETWAALSTAVMVKSL